MNCEQIRPLLTAWLDGELSAEDTAEVERHIAGCLSCAQRAEQYRNVLVSALHNQTEGDNPQTDVTDSTPDLWNDVEKRILAERQAEETASLRREIEQMQGIVRALQAEVAQLRRQVNSQNQATRHLPGALMPGTQPARDTANLPFLL